METVDYKAETAMRQRRLAWRPVLTLAGTIALTIGLVLLPFDPSRLGSYGYGVLFVLTLLSSATVVLPSPALAAASSATSCGGAYSPSSSWPPFLFR